MLPNFCHESFIEQFGLGGKLQGKKRATRRPPPVRRDATNDSYPVARGLAPAGLRSSPIFWGAASRPSGSKLPRHK
ncbi:hypothetical protein EJA72_06800 [Pseudomonas sp. PB120]|nr:hypothetical protein [Pseudomonas sp. PB120]